MEESVEPPKNERNAQRPWLWPLIGVIAVATLLAVWLVPEERPEREPLPPFGAPPPALQEAPIAVPAQPEPAPPDALESEPIEEGDTARRLIAELRDQPDPDLAVAYERAEQLRADAKLTDAWLIHFFAARRGYAPSALVLGTLSDPGYREVGEDALAKADPAQALKWYKVAAGAGDREAAERLQDLRERTEQAAANGDADAQRLLLQWR